MEQVNTTVYDYVNVLKRRKKQVIIPFILILFISILIALLWPPTYRSTATILIEEQEIPSELVQSTVTSYADQRIESIRKRVMTRDNLLQIMEKYNLYPEERRDTPEELILSKMQTAVEVQTISADVTDRFGRPSQATIAFTIAFNYKQPEQAQKVANEITSLFLNENISSRRQAAEETARFLTTEADRVQARIRSLEEKIAVFKKENINLLPELNPLHLQNIENLDRELITLEGQIRAFQERKFFLEGQLAQIDPFAIIGTADGQRILGKKAQLKQLQSQYPSLLAQYSPNHPDVVKMRREIAALEKELGTGADTQELNKELLRMRNELAALTQKYSQDHPDVVKLQRAISSLESTLQTAQKASTSQSAFEPENPAYITLQAQLESVKSELNSLTTTKRNILARQTELRARLVKAPQIEQEYTSLVRERENAVRRYQDIQAKEMGAKIAEQLEIERKGQRFSLVQPPDYPLKAIKPNRTAILFLGFVFAVAGGIGFAALTEVLDHAVYEPKGLIAVLGSEPLAVIPYLENREDWIKHKRRLQIQFAMAFVAVLTVMVYVHFTLMPLDVLWFKGLNKLMGIQTSAVGD